MARPELLDFNPFFVNRAPRKVGALCYSLETL